MNEYRRLSGVMVVLVAGILVSHGHAKAQVSPQSEALCYLCDNEFDEYWLVWQHHFFTSGGLELSCLDLGTEGCHFHLLEGFCASYHSLCPFGQSDTEAAALVQQAMYYSTTGQRELLQGLETAADEVVGNGDDIRLVFRSCSGQRDIVVSMPEAGL